MIFEEEMKKAEMGDTAAMCCIGDYYYQKIREEGYKEKYEEAAVKYYKMAGECGEVYGMIKATEIGNISATAELSLFYELGVEVVVEHCEEVYHWAEKTLNFVDEHDSEYSFCRDTVLDNLYLALYNLALCYYFTNRKLKAEKLVSEIDKKVRNIQVDLLEALCIFGGKDAESRLEEVYELVAGIENNVEFAQLKKCQLEETVYAGATFLLSTFYSGVYSNFIPDLNRAVQILTFVKDTLQRENNKNLIEEELGHYHKKLFGGYKYVK